MRNTTIVLLFALMSPLFLQSQGETSNWFFGNGAGISFNADGSVTPTTNGRLDTFEGCATLSDEFGDLLFYTDGIIVYNRDHQIMENGNRLFGDPSSTQSALIVPKPGEVDIYFVFTVDTKISENDPDRGLNYSIVDISMNAGLGKVTQKNIPLLADCSEKIAAVVKDCSNQSIWLVTFASVDGSRAIFDTFHAFEINDTGVIRPSIKTTFDNLSIVDPRGYLKISPDGTKLANANMGNGLFIYDFDALTGIVSNQEKLSISGGYTAPYGVEFSPNNQYLYTHTSNDIFANSGHRSSLIQYDLSSGDISGSQEILDSREVYRGALQLGDNGKIYRTNAKNYFEGSPFLSVINNPNEKGDATNYAHKAISLNEKKATQGLPPFIQSFFNKEGLIKNQDGTTNSFLALCAGESFTLQTDAVPDGIYMWEKDGLLLPNTENVLEIPIATDADSGKYRLTITTLNPADCPIIGEAQINVTPLPIANELFLDQCDVDGVMSDGFSKINLEQATNEGDFEITFYASLQDQNDKNAIQNPNNYTNTQAFNQTLYYEVTNELGCSAFEKLTISVNPTLITPSESSPVMICDDSSEDEILQGTFDLEALRQNDFSNAEVTFYHKLEDLALEQNRISGNLTTTSTAIYVRIENMNQCQGVERIELIVQPLPEIIFETNYQVCTDGDPLNLTAPVGFDTYRWYKIDDNQTQEFSADQSVAIADGGAYSLELGRNYQSGTGILNCSSQVEFIVNASNRAVFTEINIDDFSDENEVSAVVSGEGNYEFSLDGLSYQDEPLFENLTPGFYTLFARDKNGCGITDEDISVVGFPKFFTPNGDGSNDTWQLIGASKDLVQGSIAIYDRYGKLLKQISATEKGWDGTVDGLQLPASDYWFRIFVGADKQFKGHFTLKR